MTKTSIDTNERHEQECEEIYLILNPQSPTTSWDAHYQYFREGYMAALAHISTKCKCTKENKF